MRRQWVVMPSIIQIVRFFASYFKLVLQSFSSERVKHKRAITKHLCVYKRLEVNVHHRLQKMIDYNVAVP